MTFRSLLTMAVMIFTATQMTEAKTVVFYPPPLASYLIYHTKVAGALASLGHDVWLCVPDYLVEQDLVKDKSVKILQYGKHLGNVLAKLHEKTKTLDRFWEGEDMFKISSIYEVGVEFVKISEYVLSDKTFVDKVRSLKPELIVLESILFNMNMIVLPYMLDIPYAFIGTLHDVVISKVPYSPAEPIFPGNHFSDRTSFSDRLQFFIYYLARINFDLFYDSSLVSRFAPHKPYKSINDLAAKAEVFVAEVDHILDYPRTTLPNTKLIGGSSASPAKPLVGEFRKFADESKTGIIVFTFGGNILDLPPHITSKLISAFKQLDLRVVWRANITSPDPSRILTSKWIPQNDLLGHNKTKLFISHCGKNGQYEALFHGVPILCLPFFGDQGYNSERIQVKELGLRADIREASADELAAMMRQIVYEGKYTENMKKASSLYRELYKVPQKEAAFWFDHVMQYGGDYMRSTCQQMPWYQIFVLDIIAFIVTIAGLIILFLYLLIRQCCRLCRGNTEKRKIKKE